MKSQFLLLLGQIVNQEDVKESAEKLEEMTKASFWANIEWSKIIKPLILAVIIFFIGYYLIKLVTKLLDAVLKKQNINEGLIHLLIVVTQSILYFILATIIAGNLGLKTTSLVALIGTLGISIGLALQGTLADLASGILLVFLQPIRVRDYVYMEPVDGLLRVHAIRLFQTEFTNYSGFHIYLPNKTVLSSAVKNISRQSRVGAQVRVVVDYEEDVDKVLKVAEEALKTTKLIDHSHKYSIFLDELLDYGVAYVIRGYTNDENYTSACTEIAVAVKEAFQREGIRFARKTLRLEDVHVS